MHKHERYCKEGKGKIRRYQRQTVGTFDDT